MSGNPKSSLASMSTACITPGFGRALIALASLAALSLPATSRPQLDPEDAMIEEFHFFCVDYYAPAQCVGAVRFVLRTSGSEYFVHLHNDESRDGFLDQLAAV